MSEFCKKFGITEEQFKMQMKLGAVSTTWGAKDEIVIFFKSRKSEVGETQAVKDTADKFNKDRSYVYRIIKDPVFS